MANSAVLARLKRERDYVKKLAARYKKERDPARKAALKRALDVKAKALAKASAATKVARAKTGGLISKSPVRVSVTVEQKKAKKSAARQKAAKFLAAHRAANNAAAKAVVGTATHSALITASLAAAAAAKVEQRRSALLDKGQDLRRPAKIPEGHATPRKKFYLKKSVKKPSSALVTTMSQKIAVGMPARPQETRQQRHLRGQAYLKRALVRYQAHRGHAFPAVPNGPMPVLPPETALETAVNESLVEDSSALESEYEAGGEAVDSAADSMDDWIYEYEDEISEAFDSTGEGVATDDPALAAAMQAAEGADANDVDLLVAEADALVSSEEGIFTPRNIAIGAAVVAGLYFITRR